MSTRFLSVLLAFGFLMITGLNGWTQSMKDTLPKFSNLSIETKMLFKIKPDTEGTFNIATGQVYETLIVSRKALSKKQLRKLMKVLLNQKSYTSLSSNAPHASTSVAGTCKTKQDPSTNSSSSSTVGATSDSTSMNSNTSMENPSNSGKEVQVSNGVIASVPSLPLILSLSNEVISNRYTDIINVGNQRYVNVAFCVNMLEKNARIYAYLQPSNLKHAYGQANPYITAGKLTPKGLDKLKKLLN